MIDTGNYIFYNKNSIFKKSYFFNILGVISKSYIGSIISRIYDYYFINSRSLNKEYRKYYRKEFNTFEDYLNKKHNLFKYEIDKLNNKNVYYSEKHIAERHVVREFLGDIYEDNIIKVRLSNILNLDNEKQEDDYYED